VAGGVHGGGMRSGNSGGGFLLQGRKRPQGGRMAVGLAWQGEEGEMGGLHSRTGPNE
jgi:hypothetical protein